MRVQEETGRKGPPLHGDSLVGLERPLFGQFARHVFGLRSERLAACLQVQRQKGGRLGEVLRQEELLTRQQVGHLLRLQARWVAQAAQADMQPAGFPYPATLSLCLPAYNEQDNIEDTLDAACAILPEFVQNFEVMVVDDGSTDGTGELIAAYAGREPRVHLIRHEQNRGYGAAVTSALRAAQGDLVTFTDSDGQFCLLELAQLLTLLDGCDVVIGYRHQRADSWTRELNAWAWNRLIRFLLGVRVRDLDCAFKLFRREVIDRLHLTSAGAAISAEILMRCVGMGLQIRETPVSHYPRCHGAPSGARLQVILRAFQELPRLWKCRTGDCGSSNGNPQSAIDNPQSLPPTDTAVPHLSSNGVQR
jgi:hypothetical protein